LPPDLEIQIKRLAREKNKEVFLRKCFDFVALRNSGKRYEFITEFGKVFESRLEKIWRDKNYAPSTATTFLLRTMLVKSGKFKNHEIKQKMTLNWFIIPHQYLQVKISKNKTIFLDPWAYKFGVPFGKYARGIQAGKLFVIKK